MTSSRSAWNGAVTPGCTAANRPSDHDVSSPMVMAPNAACGTGHARAIVACPCRDSPCRSCDMYTWATVLCGVSAGSQAGSGGPPVITLKAHHKQTQRRTTERDIHRLHLVRGGMHELAVPSSASQSRSNPACGPSATLPQDRRLPHLSTRGSQQPLPRPLASLSGFRQRSQHGCYYSLCSASADCVATAQGYSHPRERDHDGGRGFQQAGRAAGVRQHSVRHRHRADAAGSCRRGGLAVEAGAPHTCSS